MTTEKTAILILAAFMLTGLAAADSPDLPDPGLTPDSFFYPLEKMSEKLELAVARAPVIGSEELEAKVRANHAAETLAEARAMAEENKTEQVEKLMNRYSENMNKSVESASSASQEELKKRLSNVTENQNRVLEELDKRVPEQARKGIQNAMENNRKNQEKLGNASGRAPEGTGPETGKPGQEANKSSAAESSPSPITGRSTTPEQNKSKGKDSAQSKEQPPENPETQQKPESGEKDVETPGSTADNGQDTAEGAGKGGRP